MQSSALSRSLLRVAGFAGALAIVAPIAGAAPPAGQPAPPTAPPAPPAEARPDSRPGPLDVVVLFSADSTHIDPVSKTSLEDLGRWLRQDRNRTVSVEAHPEQVSGAGFNRELETAQARAIRDALIAHGAITEQIVIVSPDATAKSGATPNGTNHRTVFIASLAGPVSAAPGPAQEEGTAESQAEAEPAPPPGPPPGLGRPTAPGTAPATPETRRVYPPPPEPNYLSAFGLSLSVGAGVTGFTDSDTRRFSNTGASLVARLTVGTRSPLAIEAAYRGTIHDINALGLDSSAVLLSNSAEGDLRFNLTDMDLQPYLFVGLGYSRYAIENTDFNHSDIKNRDDVGVVPLGAGVTVLSNGLLVDVRGTMRATFDDDLIPRSAAANRHRNSLDSWEMTAHVGWEF